MNDVLRRRVAWVLPLAAAALLRGLLALDAADAPLFGDEATLRRLGDLWSTHGVYVGEWPPAVPWLLARLQALAGLGPNVAWVRALDAVASTLTVAALMALGARAGGRRAGLIAGWIAACSVSLAVWAGLLYTEALFVLLFTLALLCAARLLGDERPPRALPLLVGALLGAGLYVRAAGFVLAVAVAVGVALARARAARPRRGLVESAAIVVTALAVFAPWSVRSTLVVGDSKWASATGAGNVALGWSGAPIPFERAGLRDEDVRAAPLGGLRRWLEAPGPPVPGPEVFADGATMAQHARERVAEVLRGHPGWALRSRLVQVSEVFTPLSFAHRALRLGQLDGFAARPWARRALALGGALVSGAVLLLALVAVARRAAPAWLEALALALALAHLAVPVAMFGLSRFRAPLEPVLVVLAALALAPPSAPAAPPSGPLRRATVIGLGALVLATQVVSLPVVVAALRASW